MLPALSTCPEILWFRLAEVCLETIQLCKSKLHSVLFFSRNGLFRVLVQWISERTNYVAAQFLWEMSYIYVYDYKTEIHRGMRLKFILIPFMLKMFSIENFTKRPIKFRIQVNRCCNKVYFTLFLQYFIWPKYTDDRELLNNIYTCL